jgi:hypothetical protein
MSILQAFCVDLHKTLEVLDFSGDELAADLLFYNVKKPTDLTNNTRIVFNTEAEAEAFLKEYKATLKGLNNKKDCIDRKLPNVLAKRRYIVLAKMKRKMQTMRDKPLKIKKGDMFNLYDQTYFLTVKCTKVEEKNGLFIYTYTL